jgi:hypothetical protein
MIGANTSVGGYTCYRCHAFIPNGCTHSCPTTLLYQPSPPPAPMRMDHGFAYAAALERIAVALEEIVKSLAKGSV